MYVSRAMKPERNHRKIRLMSRKQIIDQVAGEAAHSYEMSCSWREASIYVRERLAEEGLKVNGKLVGYVVNLAKLKWQAIGMSVKREIECC